MNICTECKHFKASAFSETKFHECTNPDCRHPVSGRPQACVLMRKKGSPCGVSGALWALGNVGKTIKISEAKKQIKKAA